MRKITLPLIILAVLILNSTLAHAHCPFCTAVTGSAVAAARLFGLSDPTIGLLIGAFVISGSLWANNLLKRKNKGREYIPRQSLLIILLSLGSMLLGVYFALFDELLGWVSINYIVFGTLLGSTIYYGTAQVHYYLQEINDGKNFVPFQGFIMLSAVMGLSISIVYLITGTV